MKSYNTPIIEFNFSYCKDVLSTSTNDLLIRDGEWKEVGIE